MVSVIVPIYNASQYLRQCIDSIIMQSFTDLEILLINDGSTDDSQSIIDSYASRDSRIRAFCNSNQGVSASIGYGVAESLGEYIVFIDSDDYYDSKFVDTMYRAMVDRDADCVCCDFYDLYEDGKTVQRNNFADAFTTNQTMNLANCLFHNQHLVVNPCRWNKIYKGNILKKLAGTYCNVSMGEDFQLNFSYLLLCKSICYVDYAGYYYRIIGSSLSRLVKQNWLDYTVVLEYCINNCNGDKDLIGKIYDYAVDCCKVEISRHIALKASSQYLRSVFASDLVQKAIKHCMPSASLKNKCYLMLIKHRQVGLIRKYANMATSRSK